MARRSVLLWAGLVVAAWAVGPSSVAAADAAWTTCAGQGAPADSIAGCSAVLARGDRETAVNRSIAYTNRGNAYDAKGDHDHAIADYDKAIQTNPKYVDAYLGRGVVYEARGDHDRAIADYDKAIQLDPKYANAYYNRGIVYGRRGDNDRAIADYDEAIQIDPKHGPSYFNRGVAYERKGDLASAIDDYRKDLELEPGDRLSTDAIHRVEAKLTATRPPDAPAKPAAPSERRVALVIGNASYATVGVLPNPASDARAVAQALRASGFGVTVEQDLTREALVKALAAFAEDAATAAWALVYFSGHGLEIGGVNYVVPTDAKLLTDTAVGFEAVPLGQLMAAVDGARKLRLVILDACRSNPFASRMRVAGASRAPSRGLARPPEPDPGELVVYAAREGQLASDGDGANSPFTAALVKEIRSSHVDIRRLFDLVRDDVRDATGGRQVPFTYGSLPGREDFLFSPKP